MKNLMKACVLSVAMLVLMCGAAGADDFYPQGSVMVPDLVCYYASPECYASPRLVLTNVTGETVQCQVTIYDNDGNDVTSFGRVYSGTNNGWTTISIGTGNFELPPHSSRFFCVTSPNSQTKYFVGYGVVEWTSTDPLLRKALIGGVWWERKDASTYGMSGGHFLINNGQPF